MIPDYGALVNDTESSSGEQLRYWREFFLLCVDARYIGAYRAYLRRRVQVVAIIQTAASSATITAWINKPDPPWKWIWVSILVAAQITSVLENVYAWSKQVENLGRWTKTLNRLFVEAQRNWEDIYSGKCTDAQIRRMLHQLRTRKQKAEERYIPNGLVRKEKLFDTAQKEAVQSFATIYDGIDE